MPTRTEVEMERGRRIAERAKRQSDLSRFIKGKKVRVMVAMPGHPCYEPQGRVNLFYVDDVLIGHENEMSDEYPSETLMAKIQLSVGATVGYDGIPSATTIDEDTRHRRNVYRDQIRANLQRSQGNA